MAQEDAAERPSALRLDVVVPSNGLVQRRPQTLDLLHWNQPLANQVTGLDQRPYLLHRGQHLDSPSRIPAVRIPRTIGQSMAPRYGYLIKPHTHPLTPAQS